MFKRENAAYIFFRCEHVWIGSMIIMSTYLLPFSLSISLTLSFSLMGIFIPSLGVSLNNSPSLHAPLSLSPSLVALLKSYFRVPAEFFSFYRSRQCPSRRRRRRKWRSGRQIWRPDPDAAQSCNVRSSAAATFFFLSFFLCVCVCVCVWVFVCVNKRKKVDQWKTLN